LKKSLFSISAATLLAVTSIPAKALDDGLVYVATPPCRIADTRGGGGAITANTSINLRSYGQDLSAQGGGNCPRPRAFSEPVAISAYVIAVPPNASSGSGVLTAYPAGDEVPAVGEGSTVNFAAQQVIGNTTTITLGTGSQFAMLARNTDQHVVVDVQGYFYRAAGSCANDMVAAGSVCVDRYEASVWSTATGGTQYGIAGAADYPCPDSGTGCGAGEANPIYARSVANVQPSTGISWYQAQQACANAGKRLATTTEWQMAASGTQSGTASGCNFSGIATLTGTNTGCESTSGATDMIGNVWEWLADVDLGGDITTTNNGRFRAIGDGYNNNGDASIRALQVFDGAGAGDDGPQTADAELGFRCAR
jgi:hypothetical protein